jgi:hypothetical protein
MVDNYFVEARRRSKKDLLDFLRTNKGEYTLDQMIAQYSFHKGYKVSTLMMWVDELKSAGMIAQKGGRIE